MGLGDIKVSSYLDQPFSADIELIDVGNTPLSGIKVNLASPEEFERVGLERAYALSLLNFSVEKHANGKAFIRVSSIERITDPFMQLLIDLAWAEGQVYRSYTVLLDPPNYKLSIVKHQLNNIVNRQRDDASSSGSATQDQTTYSQVERAPSSTSIESQRGTTYGPTLTNETIWQIAQHYKTSDISLQQIILAIVGTNPQAFTEGNLNGLKDASRLQIPAGSVISKVPVSLARFEVLAHDKAWQARAPIEHALLPPYIDTAAPTSGVEQQTPSANQSEIPPTPTFSTSAVAGTATRFLPLVSSLINVGEDAVITNGDSKNNAAATKQARIHADMDIAAAAIASVREVNTVLVEQLRALQIDNKRLQQQLATRTQEMKQLRNKMNVLLKRQGIVGQVSKQDIETEKNSVLPWFLLLLVLGGCGFFYWTFWIRPKGEHAGDVMVKRVTPPLEPVVPPDIEEIPEENRVPLDRPVVLPVEEKRISAKIDEQQSELTVDEDDSADERTGASDPIIPVEDKSAISLEDQDSTDDNMQVLDSIQPSEDTAALSVQEQDSTDDSKQSIEAITVEDKTASPVVDQHSASDSIPLEPMPFAMEEAPEIISEPVKAIEQPAKIKQEVSQQEEPVHEDEHVLEFEPGLVSAADPSSETAEMIPEPKEKGAQKEMDDNSIEFVLNPVEEIPPSAEAIQPVKSKAALETLLALAKTYIGMEDIEAARQSLQEVLDFGNEKQKSEAKKLLDELDQK